MSCGWINLSGQQFDYPVIGQGSPALCEYQQIAQISMSGCIIPKCPFCFMSTIKLPSHVDYFDHDNQIGHTIAGVATSFFFFSYARQEICISRPIDYAAQCQNPHQPKHQSTVYRGKLYDYYYIVHINTVAGGMQNKFVPY